MLEKVKGPELGKLRTMRLIEAEFQMLTQIFANERMAGKIEKDERISKGFEK